VRTNLVVAEKNRRAMAQTVPERTALVAKTGRRGAAGRRWRRRVVRGIAGRHGRQSPVVGSRVPAKQNHRTYRNIESSRTAGVLNRQRGAGVLVW